jgi:hypothetical protein
LNHPKNPNESATSGGKAESGTKSGTVGAVLPPDVLALAEKLSALPPEARQALAALLTTKLTTR